MIKDIESIGIRKVILKSDQEHAIVALRTAIMGQRQHETIPENAPAEDSKANGRDENAIRQECAQVRSMNSALDSRVQKKNTRASSRAIVDD